MERHQHGKDWMSVLACSNASCREAFAVTNAIDVIDYRYLGIARQQEVSVQGMRRAVLAWAHGTHQRLAGHLCPQHAGPAAPGGAGAEQVDWRGVSITDIDDICDSGVPRGAR